jgi:XisH protein
MSAKDLYHGVVVTALIKDGWTITHDPYPLQAGRLDLAIDLGAEKTIAAQRNNEKIAVEIKSFLGSSKISAFYGALGQFITYREALQIQEPDRRLFLAIPSDIYDKFILDAFIQRLIHKNSVPLVVYDISSEVISEWPI